MATMKQICKVANELDEAAGQLQTLKDRKQALQDELVDLNARINQQQDGVAAAMASLKTLVNE